jgi:hypothetical protein
VVVAVGETVRDPEAPDAEKPVPVQVAAFVLLHMSVEDCPLGIERPKAERVADGAGAVAACATAIAEGFVGCEGAPTLQGGTSCRSSLGTVANWREHGSVPCSMGCRNLEMNWPLVLKLLKGK